MQAAHAWRGDASILDEVRRRALDLRADAAQADANPWRMGLATLLLAATLLFLLIGPNPYSHGTTLDLQTNGATMSPLHRYAWSVLTVMALPVLWLHRTELAGVAKRMWPLLLLLTWFEITTTWALDPPTSKRRFFLLCCQATICAACTVGLKRPRDMHRALAICCATIVLIDLASWIFLPRLSQTDIGLAAIHDHKNTLGLAMMFADFVCATFFFMQKEWRGRLFWGFIVVAATALLIASKSKTSINLTLAALVAAPMLLAVLRSRRGFLFSVASLAFAALAVAVLAWLCISYTSGRDPLAPIRGVTFTKRTDVWQFVLAQAELRPLKGAGYLSFWDIDPVVQPSLQTDYWFAQPNSPTNEAHDGYLDLLVTTGFIGLGLALFVILRWIVRGLMLLRHALRSHSAEVRAGLPYLAFACLFPVLIMLHNLMESSYFNTVSLFSFMVMLLGIDVDLRFPRSAQPARPRISLKAAA